jgi:hypothetical protein
MDPANILAVIALIIALGGVLISTSAMIALIRRINVVHDLVNSDMTIALQDALTAKRLLRHNLASTLLLKETQGLEITQEELDALVTVDAEISERMNALAARVKTKAKTILENENVSTESTITANDEKGNIMGGIGDMSKEEAAKLEAEGAPLTAQQQAEFAASQAHHTGGEEVHHTADLHEVGFAASTEMTSPGGPWHGLPPEAATDPNHPDWAENCRWACVQGSFFACTFDGTSNVGDHAENVRGYGVPTDEGMGYMRTISTLPEDQKIKKCIEAGNDIVYNGANPGYTK